MSLVNEPICDVTGLEARWEMVWDDGYCMKFNSASTMVDHLRNKSNINIKTFNIYDMEKAICNGKIRDRLFTRFRDAGINLITNLRNSQVLFEDE